MRRAPLTQNVSHLMKIEVTASPSKEDEAYVVAANPRLQ